MCYERRRAEACVDDITKLFVYLFTKLFLPQDFFPRNFQNVCGVPERLMRAIEKLSVIGAGQGYCRGGRLLLEASVGRTMNTNCRCLP